jgi:CheY-like chemotaxis protein
MKSIMIVDDSELIRRQLRPYFESQPEFEICGEAVDGVDALRQAQELKPDLIILDLAMPRMNGLQAARRLRADSPLSSDYSVHRKCGRAATKRSVNVWGKCGGAQVESAGTQTAHRHATEVTLLDSCPQTRELQG